MQSVLRHERTNERRRDGQRRDSTRLEHSRKKGEQSNSPEQMTLIALHALLERSDPKTTPTLDPLPTLLNLLLMQLLSDLVVLFLFDFHCSTHHNQPTKRNEARVSSRLFFPSTLRASAQGPKETRKKRDETRERERERRTHSTSPPTNPSPPPTPHCTSLWISLSTCKELVWSCRDEDPSPWRLGSARYNPKKEEGR